MRAALALIACASLAGVAVSAAHAQVEDPRGFRLTERVSPDPRDVSSSTAPEWVMMQTARCLAKDRPGDVSAYLLTIPASPEEDSAYEVFSKALNRCIPDMDMSSLGNAERGRGTLTLSFDHSALRGALAESVMRVREQEISPVVLALGDEGMYLAERVHGQRSANLGRAFALGFAGCVVGHNPDEIEGLLATRPGSPDEKAAVSAMAPSFAGCVMEGQTLRLSAATLRNQIAEMVFYAHSARSEPGAAQ